MGDSHPRGASNAFSSCTSSFSSPCASLCSLLASAVTRGHRRGLGPAACSNSGSGRGEGGATTEGVYPFGGEPSPRGGRTEATDGAGVADPAGAAVNSTTLLAAKPLDQMTPREVMRLLPAEDQEHVMRVAKQGRLFGLISAAAAGTWVYKTLRRRGSPFPIVGGAAIGLALGYPLGITLTMTFHGRFLRRISHDLMETQRRARERISREGPSAAEYYSTFPAEMSAGEPQSGPHWGDDAAAEAAGRQQRQEWGDSTELLDDTRAAGVATATQQPQPPGGEPGAGGASKNPRVDGTGKGDEILKV